MKPIDSGALLEAVKLMLFGMIGVFVVLFILYLASKALLYLFPPKGKEERS